MGNQRSATSAGNLAEKLAEVWHGRAGEAMLDLYDRQRRTSNIEFVQKASIRNKKMVEERDPEVRKTSQAQMAAIARDPALCLNHLLESSMINSVRAAALIE